MREPLLTLRDVSLGYEGRAILEHVSITVEQGDFVGLLGPNGAGKTTLLRGIVGLIPIREGTLEYGFDRGSRPLGYVPQRDTLDPIFPLTAHEVVLMGTYARLPPLRPVARTEHHLAARCLEQVGMQTVAEQRFASLSGGQKQRVLIARALAADPCLLVLDEPTAGVDPGAAAAIMEVVAGLNRERGLTVLLVTHQLRMLRPLASVVIWVQGGRAVRGPADQMLAPERIADVLGAIGAGGVSMLLEMLSPNFLLHDALMGSVLVGVVCPLIGVYFVLRRMIFLGVALPQLSAAGIAFSFLAYRTVVGPHQHFEIGERVLAMLGSSGFTLAGILVLAAFERRGRDTVEARIGATYGIAGALTILFLAADPLGEAQMVNLLKGDLLATTGTGLTVLTCVFSAVVTVLLAFRKEFLLVSFDRDLAIVFGKHAAAWDTLLYLLSGVTISFGVMTAGPIVTFGFLVIPPLAARLVTRHMIAFSLASSAIGGLASFVGFYCAYRFDLPLGPAEVAVASLVLAVIGTANWLLKS